MKRFKVFLAVVTAVFVLVGCAARQSGEESSPDGAASRSEAGTDRPEVTVAVQKSIPFAETADVRESVRKQCNLQTKTPAFVQEFGPRFGVEVRLVEDLDRADAPRKLELAITRIHSPGGGGFGGTRWMQVEGTLTENGRTVGSVASRRLTTGGYFAMYKSTCDIIGRSSRAIGEDLARWLADPRDGARLGDL